jgi:hypothetical protein
MASPPCLAAQVVRWPCVYAAALRPGSVRLARPTIFAAFFYPFTFKKDNSARATLLPQALPLFDRREWHFNNRAFARAASSVA